MIPVYSIVGWKNSGKTTFITELIRDLKSSGLKVASIKHNAHNFKLDHKGKDSWKHRNSGADTVIISSKEKEAVIKNVNQPTKVEELIKTYVDETYDVVLIEGHKNGNYPKIEIFRPDQHNEFVLKLKDTYIRIINDFKSKELLIEEARKISSLIQNELRR